MAHPNTTPRAPRSEEAVTVLFCLIDDAYALLNPRGDIYGSLKGLSDSEVLTLALLLQQSCGAWRASGRSCATLRVRGSSRTSSQAW
jgi:hypothetical protein